MTEYRSPFEIKEGERPRVDWREYTLHPQTYEAPSRHIRFTVQDLLKVVTVLIVLAPVAAVSAVLIGSLGLLFWLVVVLSFVGRLSS